ncbi:hypothetical protein Syun_031248 [Stephania yunnanensis]|uniref:Uncharacterized protein n=1 Tax=Stephania yunnanensis TaxID=152371 RepID=A0AAP0HDU2_9MAGN
MDDDEAEQQGVDADDCWQLWLLCSCCLDVGACGIALSRASLSCQMEITTLPLTLQSIFTESPLFLRFHPCPPVSATPEEIQQPCSIRRWRRRGGSEEEEALIVTNAVAKKKVTMRERTRCELGGVESFKQWRRREMCENEVLRLARIVLGCVSGGVGYLNNSVEGRAEDCATSSSSG